MKKMNIIHLCMKDYPHCSKDLYLSENDNVLKTYAHKLITPLYKVTQ